MNDVEVNVIGVEPLETPFAGSEDVPSRKPGLRDRLAGSETDLGGDHNVLSPVTERLAENRLGLSPGIPVGCVKEIDAGLERSLDHRFGVFLINFENRRNRGIAAKCHRAKRKPRDNQAGVTESYVLHEIPSPWLSVYGFGLFD